MSLIAGVLSGIAILLITAKEESAPGGEIYYLPDGIIILDHKPIPESEYLLVEGRI